MKELLIFSGVTFTGYLIIIYWLFGWIPSISQSYYEFQARYGNKYTWLFTVVLALFAMPIMVYGLNRFEGNNFQFLFFLAPTGILFTAFAPQFKESLTSNVHYIGALVGIICGILAIILILKLYLAVFCWFILCGLIYGFKINNYLYWVEVISFYLILIALLII